MKIDHDGECVVVQIGNELCVLSVREAFDAVTTMMRAIDGARAYGAYLRGEVPNPDPRTDPNRRRNKRRTPHAKPE